MHTYSIYSFVKVSASEECVLFVDYICEDRDGCCLVHEEYTLTLSLYISMSDVLFSIYDF